MSPLLRSALESGAPGNSARRGQALSALLHAEILKDYYNTPHDGWREDLSAAAMQGVGIATKFRGDNGALIADAQKQQEHTREWTRILRILSKLGFPFSRAPFRTPRPAKPRSLAEVQEDVRKVTENANLAMNSADEARRSRMEQHMKERAQDSTKINRIFERMRAHNVQFPAESELPLEIRRRLEGMNECLRLYMQSHPLGVGSPAPPAYSVRGRRSCSRSSRSTHSGARRATARCASSRALRSGL